MGTLSGLVAGLYLFPVPDAPLDTLLESFLLAALIPVAVITLLRIVHPVRVPFDFGSLAGMVRRLDGV